MKEEEKLKGITVNGVSLNQFLKKNEYREVENQKSSSSYFQEEYREIIEKRKSVRGMGHKSKPHHYKKLSPSKGRKLNMSEINKEYLETNLKGQSTLAGKVLCVLLTGGEWRSEDIYKEINRLTPNSHQGRMLRKQDVYAGTSWLSNSQFAPLFNKEKVGSNVIYSLHENCYEHSPSDLMKVAYKKDKTMTVKDVIGVDLKETLKEEEDQRLPMEANADYLYRDPEEEKHKSVVSSALSSLAENLIKIVKEVENLKVTSHNLQIDVNVKFGWIKQE